VPDALVHVIVNRDKPWGVVMKKYNGDGPGYGLFDFATATRDLDAALNKPAVQPAAVAAAVWQNDFATSPTGMRPYRKGLKRAFDTLVVLLSAPFTLPVVLIASIALWLEGGSPFYRQQRIGRGGKDATKSMVPMSKRSALVMIWPSWSKPSALLSVRPGAEP